MAIEVIMPKFDMDQETGTIAEWFKKNGDHVNEGEVIMVIETDKVAVDVESPGAGILQGVSAQPGDVIPIGTVIGYLLAEGEAVPQTVAAGKINEQTVVPTNGKKLVEKAATPVAKNMAAAHGLDLSTIIPTGKDQKITKADVQAILSNSPSQEMDGKTYATPAARRIARENQVELSGLSGSGPQGRLQSRDVISYLNEIEQDSLPMMSENAEPELIPLLGMRRTIAERMTTNYQSIPHIRFTARVNMNEFINTRSRLNQRTEKSGTQKISATAMLIKLVAATLSHHPYLNSTLKEDGIQLHSEINIGVAVALENGLIVPVIKNANLKGFSEIAQEVSDLSARARAGKLTSVEVKGGTFTISNLGPFGIEQFDAIINAPEAAILAVGSTHLEAIPDKDGHIIACPIMRMTLSADHRIVDGAVAARFVADLKAVMEDPILIAY